MVLIVGRAWDRLGGNMGLSRAESPLLAAEPVSQVWAGLYGQISAITLSW